MGGGGGVGACGDCDAFDSDAGVDLSTTTCLISRRVGCGVPLGDQIPTQKKISLIRLRIFEHRIQ